MSKNKRDRRFTSRDETPRPLDGAILRGDHIVSGDGTRRLEILREGGLYGDTVEVAYMRSGPEEAGFLGDWDGARGLVFDDEANGKPVPGDAFTRAFLDSALPMLPAALAESRRLQPLWERRAIEEGWDEPGMNDIEPEDPPQIEGWMIEALRHGWRPGPATDPETLLRYEEGEEPDTDLADLADLEPGPGDDPGSRIPLSGLGAVEQVVHQQIAEHGLEAPAVALIVTPDFEVVRHFVNEYDVDGLLSAGDLYSFFVERGALQTIIESETGMPDELRSAVEEQLSDEGTIPAFTVRADGQKHMLFVPFPHPIPVPPSTGGEEDDDFEVDIVRLRPKFEEQVRLHRITVARECLCLAEEESVLVALVNDLGGHGLAVHKESCMYSLFVHRAVALQAIDRGRLVIASGPQGNDLFVPPDRIPVLAVASDENGVLTCVSTTMAMEQPDPRPSGRPTSNAPN
jgi:hypothetical protein